ncbi:MAG TPA: phosphoribosylaminoimidazolesuccinocarboxamide synthase [Gemmatimonadaceae bacterium]|nr:phosphoribosylaminoimidazolesuccinocarboxamide synthase [Gemmatimonadaceae bacterium]
MSITMSQMQQLPLRHLRRGKVREVYEVDGSRLLLVATDRVSAFDVVMKEPVPHKGAVLTQMTAWWLRQLEHESPPRSAPALHHHMISADIDAIIGQVPTLALFREQLKGRAMLCIRAEVFPVECVVRGYISGSAWKEYREHGTLAGERLHQGLQESSRFDPPMFSPATKAETGHDQNITRAQAAEILGTAVAEELERLSLMVYSRGRDVAQERGIIIADTKFEFGRDREGRTTLIDEVMTPDSSRFWPADRYSPGGPQPSFDKQPLRDYLDGVRRAGRWNGEAPPPPLPAEVVQATSARYLDAFRRITGRDLSEVVRQ